MNDPQGHFESGLGKSIRSGLSGEQVTAGGILSAVGGWRGVFETLLPGLLFLVTFILTENVRVSVIAPAAIAILLVIVRLAQKQSLVTALSGAIGVGIAVAATLFTGKGEDYFLPGFWINGAWIVALTISLLVRWPLLGFLVGVIKNDLLGWRSERSIYVAAVFSSSIWLVLFIMRLIVQLPLYFAGNVAALGIARLAMGTPLFALVVLFTWLLFRKTLVQTNTEST